MSEARIVFDAKTLRPGRMGPATGNVWLTFDDTAFPRQDWNDFAVVILEAWASAMLRLLQGVSEHELIHFMEGPYVVDVARVPAAFRLRAISNGRDERACVDVQTLPLVESLLIASEEVLTASRNKSCWSAEADRLSGNLPALRREVVKLKN